MTAAPVYEAVEVEDAYGAESRSKGHRGRPSSNSACQKWIMLMILSVLSAVNQAICYSYAPITSIAEERWHGHLDSEELITVFFVSYIPCTFIGSWIMDRQGLAYGVLLGGVMQAVGASLRYFACSFETAAETRITLLGQVLASLAMPFMVNSPAVFSANWFPTSMRATSTNVAVNANNMGVALVYLTAPFIVHSSDDIPAWNFYVAALAVASCTVGIFVFRSAPERETDEEDAAKPRLQDEYNWGQWSAAFSHTGFWHTLVAFSAAECVFNVVTAMLGKFLRGTNFSTAQIGLVGAAFIVSTLLGGQLVVHYVDKTRSHKTATQLCLVLTVVGLVAFRLVPKVDILATLASLLFLGAALGPLQPIVLELGVECAFPTSEATVAALQQLSGNFLSAIVVPGLSALQRTSFQGARETPLEVFYSSPEWILVLITALTFVVFCFFNGTHKRYAQESRIILPHSCLEQEASCTGIANTP